MARAIGSDDFAKPKPLGILGIAPNSPYQKPNGFIDRGTYKLAIIEFDDQGGCYDRAQMAQIRDTLECLMSDGIDGAADPSKDAIFITFTHGWKHDGRTNDENLASFEDLLAKTAHHEHEVHNASGLSSPPRPVYGIFVAWRGLTLYGFELENLTFWNRQKAAHRVSTGEPRELFGRLRHYRNHRLKRGGSPLLVIVGHSFGGLIVYSALEQSLIEAASVATDRVVPGFADLVLVVNAAFGAMRYLPIQSLVDEPGISERTTLQLPVFVSATARNDDATKYMFPIGNLGTWFTQRTRGPMERKCLLHTIGHVEDLITHSIAGPKDGQPFVLKPAGAAQPNPFWIVQAEPAVIDHHNGIFQEPFLAFVATLVFLHVAKSKGHDVGEAPSDTAGVRSFSPPSIPPDGRSGAGGLAVAARGGTLAEIAAQIDAADVEK